jgi:hypothetical protein
MKIRHEVIFSNELFIWMGFWSKPIFKNQPIPFLGVFVPTLHKPCIKLQWIEPLVENLGIFVVR